MAIKWLSLYIALFCFFFTIATCHQNDTDRLSLISFKQAIQQDPFGIFSSWNDSLHFCNWHGVSCSRRHPDRVTALNLNSQGLVGSLSPHIGNLSFLSYIDLQNNSFHGQIPQEIGRLRRLQYIKLSNNSFQGNIPTNLSHCSNLVYLNLIDNKLVGNIPTELGSLSNLESLGLAINNLTGSIPPSIGNLSSLNQISLARNGLQGKIPEEISRLGKLRFLVFLDNNLIGEIPSVLFNISSITILAVSYNQLHGNIPSNIGLTLPKLSSLQLAQNRFTGPIPNSLSNASALQQLPLSYNGFSGLFPKNLGMLQNLGIIDFSDNKIQDELSFFDSLTNCSNLRVLDLASNVFSGIVPNSIANLSKSMIYIALSNNQLYNAIPLGIENLLNLRFLLFDRNNLNGPLLIDFNKLQRLEMLDLSINKFTGTIPSLGNLSMLSNLYMGFNNLHGSIPPSIGTCNNLIELDLSHNSLNGSIPKQVISLTSLSISLNLAANALTGPIPSEVGLLQNLVQLDLSDNRLSGMIPNTIGKCLRLEMLHLKGNLFEGEIPDVLSALQGLQELDISRNNFSGRIPDSIAELDGMNHLNLSYNQLQGEVPKHGIFLNASAVSLTGNNDLCGGITELKLPSCRSSNSKKNSLSTALKVIIPVIVVAMFFALLLSFLIFWRHRKRMLRKKKISMPSFKHQFLRISYAELLKATNGFSTANIIGVGSYGSVYRGILEQVEIEVAVKVLNLQQRGASNSFISECQALGSIRHRNLLKLLSVCSSMNFKGNDFKALIYEFMANGSLEKWLHVHGQERNSTNLKLIHRLNIAIDIAFAIEYLHNGSSSTIIHGDLKPSNVLLDEEMTAHIGDFGLAKIVSTISGEAMQFPSTSFAIKGSIGYVAPEYGMGEPVSIEGDVYSYGILLLEMFTGKKPTDDYFKDELNLHTLVERSLPHKVMEIVDSSILSEDARGSFKEYCVISVLRIGVACSMELPAERIKMRDVISELEKIKGIYEQGEMEQNQGNALIINI